MPSRRTDPREPSRLVTPSVYSRELGDFSVSLMCTLRPGMLGAPRVVRLVPPFALNQPNRVVRAASVGTGLAGLPVLTGGPRYVKSMVAGWPPADPPSPMPLAMAATYCA